jgi:hypothetical protein
MAQACASIHEQGLTRDEGSSLPAKKSDCCSEIRAARPIPFDAPVITMELLITSRSLLLDS